MRKGVEKARIGAENVGQRLDNFLVSKLKSVPRSHIYQLVRTGQVRINGKRCKPMQKLALDDEVRIPPLTISADQPRPVPEAVCETVQNGIIFRDSDYLVLDKPSGLAVHAGSGLHFGLIDAVRQSWPEQHWELAHRLDRETSGCLVLAAGRRPLARLQQYFRQQASSKSYLALIGGRLADDRVIVRHCLSRPLDRGGERLVMVDPGGKPAESHFRRLKTYAEAELVQVDLVTGRTHQIRVHAAAQNHPLAGDTKYGDKAFNRWARAQGLKRLFLHAHRIQLPLASGDSLLLNAPLPDELRRVLDGLETH